MVQVSLNFEFKNQTLKLMHDSIRCFLERIKSFLEKVATGSVPWTVRKVIVLGQEGVGKTTLAKCLQSKSGKIDTTKKFVFLFQQNIYQY